jgi:hypothetical protein
VRALISLFLLGALATPACAQSLQLLGYAGVLGEWEVTANVTGKNDSGVTQFSGPLTMKHIGLCTQDGPEEKTGEMRFELSGSSSRMKATLLVDGIECTYRAKLSGSYTGTMNCPDRRTVPLTLWVK